MLIIGALAYAFYMYFPQSSPSVARAAQGFAQELQRVRISAMQSGRTSAVSVSEGDLNPDIEGIQPGYLVYRGDEVINTVYFDPSNSAMRSSENLISGVQPVLWDCDAGQPATVDGNTFSFEFDASGRYLSENMTVAFGRPAEGAYPDNLSREGITTPIRFIVVTKIVGEVHTADENECMKSSKL